uniref:(California timema) hypothetical protein n=1 Tax=Timema californicum TaxID=61474 RepID=A0A7R9JJB2_TIMCA|nr:unnamed protein product [Timema californicum]
MSLEKADELPCRVLCKHILAILDTQPSFWDEWVPESRVLKYNESNVQRQKELQRSHEADPQ